VSFAFFFSACLSFFYFFRLPHPPPPYFAPDLFSLNGCSFRLLIFMHCILPPDAFSSRSGGTWLSFCRCSLLAQLHYYLALACSTPRILLRTLPRRHLGPLLFCQRSPFSFLEPLSTRTLSLDGTSPFSNIRTFSSIPAYYGLTRERSRPASSLPLREDVILRFLLPASGAC